MSKKENAVERNSKVDSVKKAKVVQNNTNKSKETAKKSTTSNSNNKLTKNTKATNNGKLKKVVEKNTNKAAKPSQTTKVSQSKTSKNSLNTKKVKEQKVENKNVKQMPKNKEMVSKKTGKELVELNKKTKVKEETIIEKIKSFLAKIAEMQEEARKEIAEIKESVKIKKEKVESEKNREEISKNNSTNYLLEYYDLPYRYNQTTVKILAQTPKRLFVYWDLSDSDRLKYVKSFGDNFFVETYPVLLLCNEEKKYVREIAINDFANSWYIDIDDPKTKYSIQLGRKFKSRPEIVNMAIFKEENIVLKTDYLPIVMSNKIEAPNDHILFENFNPKITFRNVKTNQETVKDISTFDKKISKAFNLDSFYNVYKELYKDGIEKGMFDLNNPTSGMTSSSFK